MRLSIRGNPIDEPDAQAFFTALTSAIDTGCWRELGLDYDDYNFIKGEVKLDEEDDGELTAAGDLLFHHNPLD